MNRNFKPYTGYIFNKFYSTYLKSVASSDIRPDVSKLTYMTTHGYMETGVKQNQINVLTTNVLSRQAFCFDGQFFYKKKRGEG